MASTWIGHTRIEEPSAPSWTVPIKVATIVEFGVDGQYRRGGVDPFTKTLYCDNTASDLGGGYLTLATSNDSSSIDKQCSVTAPLAGYIWCPTSGYIAEYATAAGVMNGLITTDAYVLMEYRTWWTAIGKTEPLWGHLYYYLYHRTAGGSETLIGTGYKDMASSEIDQNGNINVDADVEFGTNERLVFKTRAYFSSKIGGG